MICCECKGYFPGSLYYKTVCVDCSALMHDKGEVEAQFTVRCPFCAHKMQIEGNMDDYTIHEEGDHKLSCKNEECGKDFYVHTVLHASFVSPPLVKKE